MNKAASITLLVILSLVFLVFQSTLLSPKNLGIYSPDLNLILIIIISLLSGFKGGSILALGNGYFLDVLSGNLLGVNTISRLSVYALIRSTSENIYYNRIAVISLVIFLSTIVLWCFTWVVVKINSEIQFNISLHEILKQGSVNTVVGLPLYFLIKKLYERVQK
jgi:rod shape-determining protein MreD